MEAAVLDISSALEKLKAGHTIQRPDSNLRNTSYFLKKYHGKDHLFVRQTRLHSSEVIEEPSTFDWDDLIATNWEVVTTPSTRH
jgi:hypothetical protein